MAKRMVVTLTDDVTGEEIPENGGETVVFAMDGKTYEVDLTHDNARKMRDQFGTYTKVARMANLGNEKRRSPRGASSARTDREVSKTIRAWARNRGMKVPDRGRIPGEVLDKWEALSGTEKALAMQSYSGQDTLPEPADTGSKGGKAPANTSPPEFSEATTGKSTKATAKADTPKDTEKQPANA